MVDHCVRVFKRKYSKDLTVNQRALERLRSACEKAKRILSCTTQTTIELDCLHEGIDFSNIFTRAKFEELNMSLFEKCITILDKCLIDAKMNKSQVDKIILVGGSTRIPKPLWLQSDNKNVQDLILSDVTPLSLGINHIEDVFSILIPRNTSIPASNTIIYATLIDNQHTAHIGVYQGERAGSSDNLLLGDFQVSDIPLAPKGQSKVMVGFAIDVNGILTVTASDSALVDQENSTNWTRVFFRGQCLSAGRTGAAKKILAPIYVYYELSPVSLVLILYVINAIADTTEWLEDNQAAPFAELQAMKMHLEFVCKPLI
ncbi:heat shock 70 kDa protein-like protein [Tanacetum coccineum]